MNDWDEGVNALFVGVKKLVVVVVDVVAIHKRI